MEISTGRTGEPDCRVQEKRGCRKKSSCILMKRMVSLFVDFQLIIANDYLGRLQGEEENGEESRESSTIKNREGEKSTRK